MMENKQSGATSTSLEKILKDLHESICSWNNSMGNGYSPEGGPERFNMRVIVSPNAMTIKKEKRSWKVRLFTRPWKPFKKFYEVQTPGCYILDGNTFFVHPAIWEAIKVKIEQDHTAAEFRFMMPFGPGMSPYNPLGGIFGPGMF